MPEYKLYYFDARGGGEVARLLFSAKGQAFEDIRITREEWPKHKAEMPFGQMPVLSVDGKKFAQSMAIQNFLAREFGYYGSTNLDALAIDQVTQTIADLIQTFIKFAFEKDDVKKIELQKTFADVDIPRYMGHLKRLLTENETGYFVGDSLSLADLVVFNAVSEMESRQIGLLAKFPDVKAHYEKVLSHDNIKSYVDGRK